LFKKAKEKLQNVKKYVKVYLGTSPPNSKHVKAVLYS
jgi:hypothetical protein